MQIAIKSLENLYQLVNKKYIHKTLPLLRKILLRRFLRNLLQKESRQPPETSFTVRHSFQVVAFRGVNYIGMVDLK